MYNILYILEKSCIFAEKRNMERIVIVYMDKVSNGVVKSIIDDLVKAGEAEDVVGVDSAAGTVFVPLVYEGIYRESVVVRPSFQNGSLDEYRKVVLEVDMSHPDNKVREFKGYTPHEWECFQFEAVPGVNFKKRCVECGKQFDIKIHE